MKTEIFTAGTAPGSPNTENEIKTLVCYILVETNQPMNFSQIHHALRQENLVNYFQLVGDIASLVDSGHLEKTSKNDVDYYTLTDLGRTTANTLDTSLPFTVREKAVTAAKLILAQQQRLDEVRATITPLDEGYLLELSIPYEDDIKLTSFSLYAPTKEEAEKLRRGFLNDPVFLYKSVMALLSGDLSVLGDLKPDQNPLF